MLAERPLRIHLSNGGILDTIGMLNKHVQELGILCYVQAIKRQRCLNAGTKSILRTRSICTCPMLIWSCPNATFVCCCP